MNSKKVLQEIREKSRLHRITYNFVILKLKFRGNNGVDN